MRNATSVKELNRHSGKNPLPGVYSHREHPYFTGSLNQSLIYHLGAAPYTTLERQKNEEDSDCSRYAKGLY